MGGVISVLRIFSKRAIYKSSLTMPVIAVETNLASFPESFVASVIQACKDMGVEKHIFVTMSCNRKIYRESGAEAGNYVIIRVVSLLVGNNLDKDEEFCGKITKAAASETGVKPEGIVVFLQKTSMDKIALGGKLLKK